MRGKTRSASGKTSLRRMRPYLKEKGAGRTGEMAQLVKVLVTQAWRLRFSPRSV